MDVIEVVGGVVACTPGIVLCAVGGAVIGADNVGNDLQNHCDSSAVVDGAIGAFGAGYGAIAEAGAEALNGASTAIKGLYNGTTSAPSAIGAGVNTC